MPSIPCNLAGLLRHTSKTAIRLIEIYRHPDRSDDALVVVSVRNPRRARFCYTIAVQPGPSSAQGYAEAICDTFACFGYEADVVFRYEDDLSEAAAAGLLAMMKAAS